MTSSIHVRDQDRPLDISFDDLLKYHGGELPGGVAHAFQAMRAAFAALSDAPLDRRRIHVRTAFNGAGGRDAVEYVTRAFTQQRAFVDRSLGTPNVLAAPPGPYVWRFTYDERIATARITAGWISPEFIELGALPDRTEAQMRRLVELRWEMAERLLAAAPQDIYRVDVEPADGPPASPTRCA